MNMRRLLSLLMIVTIAFANGATASAALCRHGSAHEHAAALMSANAAAVSEAQSEDAAAAAVKAAARADAAALTLGVYIAPPEYAALVPPAERAALARPADEAMRAGRAPPPLLQPPSA